MNLADRVRNMFVSPRIEWDKIAVEKPDTSFIFTRYVLPIILVGAVAAFIGYGFIGQTIFEKEPASLSRGLYAGANRIVVSIFGIYLTSLVINELAPVFQSEKNFGRAFQLVAYAATPSLVAMLFAVYPALESIARFAGSIYAIYLWYTGLQPVMRTPESKTFSYFVVSFIGVIVAYAILGALYAAIMFPLLRV